MVPESVLFISPRGPPAEPLAAGHPPRWGEMLPDRIQWLVGYRQGLLALYQWRQSDEVGAPAAQLLWHLQLGCLPLSLSPRGWDCEEGEGAMAVGSRVHCVSISHFNHRLTATAVNLRGVAAISNLVLPSGRAGEGMWEGAMQEE